MSTLRRESNGTYVLDDRTLGEGDELEVMLGGNAGWQTVTVQSLASGLRVAFAADDGTPIVTTLTSDTIVRWPE